MELGTALTDGVLLPRNPVEAAKAFAHACEIPVPDGCTNLQRVVEQTSGASFQSACDTGDGESCFLLGSLYMSGFGVPKDAGRAFALFQRSCSAGWRRGCFGLGESYRDGNGTAIDNARAIENFDKACRAGLVPGCFSASAMYQGLHDDAAAKERLRQGCELSIGYAQSSQALVSEGSPARPPAVPPVCSSF
jgi:TPR repeat protein